MEELDKIASAVASNDAVSLALDKLVREQVESRSGHVYRLIVKVIATQNEIKKLNRALSEAEKSLGKSQELLKQARSGDFSWIQEAKSSESA